MLDMKKIYTRFQLINLFSHTVQLINAFAARGDIMKKNSKHPTEAIRWNGLVIKRGTEKKEDREREKQRTIARCTTDATESQSALWFFFAVQLEVKTK